MTEKGFDRDAPPGLTRLISRDDDNEATVSRAEITALADIGTEEGVFAEGESRILKKNVLVEQGGIGLPDESYFREERFAPVREKYREFIEVLQFGNADVPTPIFRHETAVVTEKGAVGSVSG